MRTPRLYLNVSRGKMRNKDAEKALDGFEGYLRELQFKIKEYQEQKTPSWIAVMVDPDEGDREVLVQFNGKSYYSLGFFRRIQQVDLTKKFLIGAYTPKDANEKLSMCYMKQLGQKVEANKELVPDPQVVQVGGEDIKDFSDAIRSCKEIAERINAQLRQIVAQTPRTPEPENSPVPPPDEAPF